MSWDHVKLVEDESPVEDVSRRSARLMRVGTHIADNMPGFHRAFLVACGNGGKCGSEMSLAELVFQMSGDAQAGFRNSGRQ
jgi:hypothetical protein